MSLQDKIDYVLENFVVDMSDDGDGSVLGLQLGNIDVVCRGHDVLGQMVDEIREALLSGRIAISK